MDMRQPGTDKGTRGETGEKYPAGVKSSDEGGERKEKLVGGVAQGKRDQITGRDGAHLGKHEGLVGEANEGRKEGTFYTHKKSEYRPGKY